MKTGKRNIILLSILLFIIVGASTIFILWKSQPKGITIAISELPDSLNPILPQNISGMNASELIFDGLVNFEVDYLSKKLYPEFALAESIEQDPLTKKIYTVVLRDISWHDGRKLTADDVVFSFDAYMDPANESPQRAYLSSFIKKIEKVDNRTISIEFNDPIPPFRVYPILTFKIIPSVYNDKKMSTNLRSGENERNFAVEPIGTGPYRFTKWEIGKWIIFSSNESYFRRVPVISTLILKKVLDPVIRMNELKKGRINMILETSPMDRVKVEKIRGVDINSYLPFAFYQVFINCKKFTDPEARKAMAQAIDRASLVPGVTDADSGVVIGSSVFPADLFMSNIPEYMNSPVPDLLPEDLDKAKKMAEVSGLSGKTAILLYPDSLGDFGEAVATSISDQLRQIGFEVEPKRTGDQVFNRLVFIDHNYDLALAYSEGFDNLYSSLGSYFTSDGELNVTGISDKELDALFQKWEKAVKVVDWLDLTLEINKKMAELSPSIFLFKIQKDVYTKGLKDVNIATDNPFLSVEEWSF
ncbi:ABC transporter substrate-binding protein [Spirochaetia bacterium 38H-sp]|uniref:ABC transporter substrate-binding protein n=1 Tax=Rarispira pelagica TaxID=3141764 RepID=A0ABU9UBA5_9SPIR